MRKWAGSPQGISPPRLPQIRTGPIKASGSSRRGFVVPRVYPQGMVAHVLRFDALHVAHSHGPTTRHALPSSGSRRCGSPGSQVLWRAPTPRRPSRRTSLPSLGDTIGATFVRTRQPRLRGQRIILELVSRCSIRPVRWKRRGLPSSRETLLIIRPVLRPRRDRAGPLGPGLTCSTWPPHLTTTKAHHILCFRGSIARLLISLSTLRRGGYPSATQDSLPAAGPALPDGIGYPQGSDERFRAISCPPLPSFLAQCHPISWGFSALCRYQWFKNRATPLRILPKAGLATLQSSW